MRRADSFDRRGRSPSVGAGQRFRIDGFTLLEVLVALVIVSVLVGMLAWSVSGAGRGLHFEAQRLAQLLILAREEAQLRGAPIRLEIDERGYRFAILRGRRWQPLVDDHDLRARAWEEPTQVQLRLAGGRDHVDFDVEQVDAPFFLRLRRDDHEERIGSTTPGAIGVLR